MESHTKVTLQSTIDFGKKYDYYLYNLNQHSADEMIEYDPEADKGRNQFWIMFLCVPKEKAATFKSKTP